MTKKLVLSAAMALLLPLLAVSSASSEDFDYYYLVQQWPGSYCSSTKQQQCCFPDSGKPAEDFGIHGLWPQYTVCRRDADADAFNIVDAARKRCRPGPADCDDGNPLSPWEIKDLLVDLNRNWPSLSCRNSAMDFWSHEWKKHGSCSGFDQRRYFERTLELKARHNLTAILAGAGIVPSDDATYHLSGVRDAIREATGFEATVECNRGAPGSGAGGRLGQLYQVYLCVAPDWSGLIDCPEPVNRKCTDKIKFPTF